MMDGARDASCFAREYLRRNADLVARPSRRQPTAPALPRSPETPASAKILPARSRARRGRRRSRSGDKVTLFEPGLTMFPPGRSPQHIWTPSISTRLVQLRGADLSMTRCAPEIVPPEMFRLVSRVRLEGPSRGNVPGAHAASSRQSSVGCRKYMSSSRFLLSLNAGLR
jgi:hypothetical protein